MLRLLNEASEATSPLSNIINEIFLVLYWNLLIKGWEKKKKEIFYRFRLLLVITQMRRSCGLRNEEVFRKL